MFDGPNLQVSADPVLGESVFRTERAGLTYADHQITEAVTLLKQLTTALDRQHQHDLVTARETAREMANIHAMIADEALQTVARWEAIAEREAAERRGRYEAQEMYLTASLTGLVRAITDLQKNTFEAQIATAQEVQNLRLDLEERSFGGRCRRFWQWLRRKVGR